MNKPKQTVEIVVTFVVVETCIWTIERWMEEPYLGCRLQSHLQVSLLYVDMTILLRLKVSYCRSWPQCPLIVFTSVRTIKIIKPKTSTLSCAHKCQQQAFVSFFFLFAQVYMPGFLTSNLYYKYLSDLINSVRADEFVNVSTPGQGAPSDNDRTSSNAMEGSHIQVSCRYLWPTASWWHLDLFYGNNSTVTDEMFW